MTATRHRWTLLVAGLVLTLAGLAGVATSGDASYGAPDPAPTAPAVGGPPSISVSPASPTLPPVLR